MTHTTHTFGDFYNLAAETQIPEGTVWLKEWQAVILKRQPCWEVVERMPLTEELITCFAVDMVRSIQVRMGQICTNELYSSTGKAGRAFLAEIAAIAEQFNVDISGTVGAPLTPTEAVAPRPS